MNTRKRNMTVLALATVVMAVVVLAAPPAGAGIVLEEQFIYDAGLINGQDGGTGFDGAWNSTKSHGQDYQAGLTTYSNGAGSTLNEDAGLYLTDPNLAFPVAGSALSRFGSAGRAQAHRLLTEESRALLTADNTTVWFSVLVSEASAHRQASFIFGTEAFSTDIPFRLAAAGEGFGITLANAAGDNDGGGIISALAFDESTSPTIAVGTFAPPIQSGATHHDTALIAGKINWKPSGTPDELFLFNITDPTSQPAEADAIASITDLDLDQSAFDTVGLWDTNSSIWDEIRFGTSFASVMGVSDPNAPDIDTGNDWITWSGEPVTIDATVTVVPGSGWTDLTYTWTAIPDGSGPDLDVEITGADQEDPTVTITKTAPAGGATVVTLTLEVASEGKEPVQASVSIDVYDDSCQAAQGAGVLELDPGDLDGNCIINLADYAIFALDWLSDYTITAPVVKP